MSSDINLDKMVDANIKKKINEVVIEMDTIS